MCHVTLLCQQGLGFDAQTGEIMRALGLWKQYQEHSMQLAVEVNHAVKDQGLRVLFRDPDLAYRR